MPQPVLFYVVPALLDYLRTTFAPDNGTSFDNRFEDIKTAEVLVLGDLGAENSTDRAHDKLSDFRLSLHT